MSLPHRCSRCQKRRTLAKPADQYKRAPVCHGCGHWRFYIDRDRIRKGRSQKCWCEGYEFVHRGGSKFCDKHPDIDANLARRHGADEADVAERVSAPADDDCPF